jgi:beta-glucosidase
MTYTRFVSSSVVASVGVWALMLVIVGCAAPGRGNGGTAGNGGPGSGGNGNSTGVAGNAGPGGSPGPGAGGAGNEVVLSGNAGTVGTGGAGNGTGTGGSPTGGSSGAAGAAGTGGVVKMVCPGGAAEPFNYAAGYTPDPTIHANAMSVATAMSNDEKAQQMSGLPQSGTADYDVFNQEDNSSRGIKGFHFRDGPRGVNINANADKKNDYSTAFPVAIARGAAFDEDLEFEVGEAIGDELLASGNTMLLAPTVNILRHPAWGRAQETYGEDVFLLGRLGSAFVTGVQQYGAACVKHYAANNIEDGRETANATMDEQTLREIYGRHFEMIIQEGGAAAVMASYNQVNGTHSTQNSHLLTDLLRTDFGFKGFVLSDWWAMPNGSSVPYPAASTLQPTAQQAVNAGLDMELPWRYNYSTLSNLVSGGNLQASQLVTSAARILEQKYRFKVDKTSGFGLRTPFTAYNVNGDSSITKNDQVDPVVGLSHIDLAEQAAEESMVLLKNANNTLPINRSTVKKIAVIGAKVSYSLQETNSQDSCQAGSMAGTLNCTLDFTTNVRTGDDGSSRVFSDPGKSMGPLAGIQADASGITVTGYNTAAAAQSAGFDFAVVIAGLTPGDEGEEYTGAGDRTTGGITSTSHSVNLGLDPKVAGGQNALIASVAALGKPMVVVLEGGSVIDVSPWISSVPAVVMAWYPGMVGGKALGRLLFGDANFSGKLPLTWDSNAADWPVFASPGGSTAMDYLSGYRYFDNKGTTLNPANGGYPFGYGLSYTTFSYDNLQVPCSTVPTTGVVNVTVDVYNNSAVAGTETVFLFVQYPSSPDAKRKLASYKELKGFHRVSLAAKGTTGDAKRITIPLRVKDLKYWTSGNAWATETGSIKVIVAPSSAAAGTICTSHPANGCGLTDNFTVTP